MKMRLMIFAVTLFFILLKAGIPASATVMVGVKTWYAYWDSSISKIFGTVIHDDFEANGFPNSVSVDPGTGYLAGPLVGYQTEDGKWSMSGAFMFLNSFDQETTMDVSGETIDINSDLERRDLDVSVGYALTERIRLIAGYKWMYMKSDVEIVVGGFTVDSNWFEIASQMPGVGVGMVYPISDKLLLSGQLGILYVLSKMKDSYGYDYNIEPTWGYNLEGACNYLVTENVLIQGGLRYQVIPLKIDEQDFQEEEQDKFLGITLSALYMF